MYKLDCSERRFAEIEAIALGGFGARLCVLENAQKLKESEWFRIVMWAEGIVAGEIPGLMLTVVTDEEKPDTAQERYRPFVEKGRYVECKEATVESLSKYCQSDYNLSNSDTALLLELCGHNFRKLNNELEKLRLVCPNGIHTVDITELVVFSPGDTLVRNLLQRDTRGANVTSVISTEEIGSLLRTLAIKLAFMLQAYRLDKPGIGAHRLAAAMSCQPWQLLEFFANKKFWSVGALEEKLRMLVDFEALWSKNQSNILPLLVQYW